jgi:predicted TPR repeat methyltransferase
MPELVRRWNEVDPEDPVARHLAASMGQRPPPARCEGEYIESFFDGFAPTYDDTLAELEYSAPQQLSELLGELAGGADASIDVIDAGCGTGLCGPRVRPLARSLVGIDLSTEMLERARSRDVYDELVHGDLVAGLAARESAADAVISADVLVYFGDLRPPFAAAARALRPGGWLLASVELGSDPERFVLAATGRYEHGEAYIRGCLAEAGLTPERAKSTRIRFDRGSAVSGLVFAARKP